MDVTVAICTHNRAASLDRTLESITRMRIPRGIKWELIVVNNRSPDNTDEVIAKYGSLLPIRREFESSLGFSNARNRAVAIARGKYIIWTDDDTIVDRELLCAYLDAFHRWPDAAFFGGKVMPDLEEPVPEWVKETWEIVPMVRTVFAFRDYGDDSVTLSATPRRLPVGANCAVRTSEQRAYPFNPLLGVRAGKPGIAAGDSYLFESLLRDGHRGYWVPQAKVRHVIARQRQTIESLRIHCLYIGRGDAFRDRWSEAPRISGAPRWLWRRALGSGVRYLFYRLTSPQKVWVKYLADHYLDRGGLEYWLKLRHMGEAPSRESLPRGSEQAGTSAQGCPVGNSTKAQS